MPGPYVTDAGLQIPTEESLLADITAEVRAEIDPKLDMSSKSVEGQIAGVFVTHLREAWEGVSIGYNAFNPDAVEGFAHDALCAVTGTTRPAATRSKVKLSVNLDASKTLPAGKIVAQEDNPSVQFETAADVTSTLAGVYTVDAQCTELGPVVANAGTLTVIVTPVVGWNSVTNVKDATVGRARAEEPELRLVRLQELRASGSANVDAISAALLALRDEDESAPIQDAIAIENTSDFVSPDLQAPHSIEAIIFDGLSHDADDDAVAQIIWDKKPAGVATFGNTSGIAIDKKLKARTVFFSRPAIDDLKIAITVAIDKNNTVSYAGEQAVKDAIVAMFRTKAVLGVRTIRATHYTKAVIRATAADGTTTGVEGVIDVPNLQIGNVLVGPFPAHMVNYTLEARTLAQLDTSDITVTVTEVDP